MSEFSAEEWNRTAQSVGLHAEAHADRATVRFWFEVGGVGVDGSWLTAQGDADRQQVLWREATTNPENLQALHAWLMASGQLVPK